MVITLEPELEAALADAARAQGIAPEVLVVNILRKRFLPDLYFQPRDEWERGLLASARDWGVVLTDEAVSREGMYD